MLEKEELDFGDDSPAIFQLNGAELGKHTKAFRAGSVSYIVTGNKYCVVTVSSKDMQCA